ncbi:MAG: hypothetical protein ABR543_08545 [Gemmatimonadaceae bacterium]
MKSEYFKLEALKRRARWIGVCLAVALIVLPFVFIKVATPPAQKVTNADQARIEPEARYRVYVAGWGYHTSVIVEQPAGFRLGPPGEEDAPFVEFAWGNRSFYMESNYWPHSVFAAVFLPTSSVNLRGRLENRTGTIAGDA